MRQSAVPASFTVLMAAVVLSGVGLGFAVAPDRASDVRALTTTTSPTTSLVTTAPTTTASAAPALALSCRVKGRFTALPAPTFIAGSSEELVQGLGRAFPDSVQIVASRTVDLKDFIPDSTGVIIVPFFDDQTASVIWPTPARFVLYDARQADLTQTSLPNPSLVLDPTGDQLKGYEQSIANLIKMPATCR